MIDPNEAIEKINLAEELTEKELSDLAQKILQGIQEDLSSRQDWEDRYDEYLKLAMQVKEEKSFPWPKAANIKYPLLTTAAMQFSARAYPALVNGNNLVRGKVIGFDETGEKAAKADRIGKHMSYQILEQLPDWEEDMDKLCLILPITGCVFKKTFWDLQQNKPSSPLILARDLIVNYWAKSLSTARRITHRFYLYNNEIIERQRAGLYLDIPIGPAKQKTKGETSEALSGQKNTNSSPEDTPHCIFESHVFIDLDEDGYEEPYIVTLDEDSQKIYRITARYTGKEITSNQKGEIIRIEPIQYFTKFGFIPNPDGGFYDVGFGLFLGSLNEVVNSSINQLLDAGTMATTGGGFISGRSLRLRPGQMSFKPNEWKVINSTVDDMRKAVFPLPVREPSSTLFSMLQAVVQSGKEIASIAEIFTGKMPGQNTPATTTMASIEQGLKVFTAIHKRLFRSLSQEFKKIFALNKENLDQNEYFAVLDPAGNIMSQGQVSVEDYNTENLDVLPAADPNIVADSQRLLKAEATMGLAERGLVNRQVAASMVIDALDLPQKEALLKVEQQPDLKATEMQMKMQMDEAKRQMDMQKKQFDLQIETQKFELEKIKQEMQIQMEAMKKQLELQNSRDKHNIDMINKMEKGELDREIARNKKSLE